MHHTRRWTAGQIYLITVTALLVLVTLVIPRTPVANTTIHRQLATTMGLLIIGGLYLLPAVIASTRRAVGTGLLTLVNLCAGWTVIGYLACLTYALTVARRPDPEDYYPDDFYRPGLPATYSPTPQITTTYIAWGACCSQSCGCPSGSHGPIAGGWSTNGPNA